MDELTDEELVDTFNEQSAECAALQELVDNLHDELNILLSETNKLSAEIIRRKMEV
jgi:hypothetical protein